MDSTKHIFSILLISLLLVPNAFAARKTKKKKPKKISQTTPITVFGSYQRKDRNHVYLKVRGAKKLIKIPQKYLLNKPIFLQDNEKLKVTLPVARYVLDNMERPTVKK